MAEDLKDTVNRVLKALKPLDGEDQETYQNRLMPVVNPELFDATKFEKWSKLEVAVMLSVISMLSETSMPAPMIASFLIELMQKVRRTPGMLVDSIQNHCTANNMDFATLIAEHIGLACKVRDLFNEAQSK